MDKVLVFDKYEDAYEQLIKAHEDRNEENMLDLTKRLSLDPTNQNLGQNLEVTDIFQLTFEDKRYCCRQLCGVIPVYYGPNLNNGYRIIPELVKDMKKCEENRPNVHGVKVDMVFYTMPEKEEPTITDAEKQEIITNLECLDKIALGLPDEEFRFWRRLTVKGLLRIVLTDKSTIRGLTEQERTEFENLYFNKENKY